MADNKHIFMYYNEYIATFRRKDTRGRLIKLATIGNTGVAFDFVRILRILGIKVTCIAQLLNSEQTHEWYISKN